MMGGQCDFTKMQSLIKKVIINNYIVFLCCIKNHRVFPNF